MGESKKIIIVGAGPGGLTSAMILANRGYDVIVYEKDSQVGGRNKNIESNGFHHDAGPTFLMMKYVLDEIFESTGRKTEDYLDCVKLEPMYQLNFGDKKIDVSSNQQIMEENISKVFPGQEQGYKKYKEGEKKRFLAMEPCLNKDYSDITSLIRPALIKALPRLSIGKSLFGVLGSYFKPEELRLTFTFQSKYLGMSPWECPGAFAIIPYVEHEFGIYHVIGGLQMISKAMEKAVEEEGGKIHLNSPVKQLIIKDGRAVGVELSDGKQEFSDCVILNSDFAWTMSNLVPKGVLKKYSEKKLFNKKYSCSTFMMYLGLDKIYDEPHHQIIFANDYRQNIDDIFHGRKTSTDLSIYVRNASITDKTLAPEGHSALYILVPVPNNKGEVDWEKESEVYSDIVLKTIMEKTGMNDLDKHIVDTKIINPDDWVNDYNVYLGATFNLAHSLDQMLYLRPRNRFEEIENCYLVGGGTHPGSGLPTIYESGRITSKLIIKDLPIEV